MRFFELYISGNFVSSSEVQLHYCLQLILTSSLECGLNFSVLKIARDEVFSTVRKAQDSNLPQVHTAKTLRLKAVPQV